MNNIIQELLIEWYVKERRSLPWREGVSSYHTWISEIMCQQTRVDTVIPYYQRFLENFPTLTDLAKANEDQLHKCWEGLGYYARVRNMQIAAKQCVEHYNSKLPSTYEELLTLQGIGPYSAGAIASIAFQQKVACVDGNVCRVVSRILNLDLDISKESTKKQYKAILEEQLPDDIASFNQGLMELGALICIPNGMPRCSICPLQEHCLAYQKGTQLHLPIKSKTTKITHQKRTVILVRCKSKVLVHQRKDTGLLAKLYEFVNLEGTLKKKELQEHFPSSKIKKLPSYRHVFSHIIWDVTVFEVILEEEVLYEDYKFIDIQVLKEEYSIPSAFQSCKDYLEGVIK